MTHILRLDSSARTTGSVTRDLLDQIETKLAPSTITRRDLGTAPVKFIDTDWVGANFTPADARTPTQTETLAQSDALIAELTAADTILIGLPVYNFAVPAVLKAWVDQVCRAGVTFKYTETGPVGLLSGKRVIVAVASGGTLMGSDIDFATGYLRHIMGFIGLTDVTFVAADQHMAQGGAALAKAQTQIEALAA